ncbi:membrane protein [Candidatus Magnetoovum chiemensis]|nr:membrane protein [Candidatus Magnetoovum chiemensis]
MLGGNELSNLFVISSNASLVAIVGILTSSHITSFPEVYIKIFLSRIYTTSSASSGLWISLRNRRSLCSRLSCYLSVCFIVSIA